MATKLCQHSFKYASLHRHSTASFVLGSGGANSIAVHPPTTNPVNFGPSPVNPFIFSPAPTRSNLTDPTATSSSWILPFTSYCFPWLPVTQRRRPVKLLPTAFHCQPKLSIPTKVLQSRLIYPASTPETKILFVLLSASFRHSSFACPASMHKHHSHSLTFTLSKIRRSKYTKIGAKLATRVIAAGASGAVMSDFAFDGDSSFADMSSSGFDILREWMRIRLWGWTSGKALLLHPLRKYSRCRRQWVACRWSRKQRC
jgi:hypothetical protein